MLKTKIRLANVVRAERVNALRKQYDAFLEEDKKRKERNEYILGRLDNMRYSATAVQLSHKPVVFGELIPVYNRAAYRPDTFERHEKQVVHPDLQINRPTPPSLQLDIPKTNLDTTALLREISKNYILIPKLRSSLANEYVATIPSQSQSLPPVAASSPQNILSNEDWKSKYDILEKLRKEEQADKYDNDDELIPVKENQSLSSNDKGYGLQSFDTKELRTKYDKEFPDKDFTSDRAKLQSSIVKNSIVSELNANVTKEAPVSTTHTNPEIMTAYESPHQQYLETNAPVKDTQETTDIYPNDNFIQPKYTSQEFNNNSQHQTNEIPSEGEYPVQYEPLVESEGTYPEANNVYLDPEDYSPIQVVDQVPTKSNLQTANDVDDIKQEMVEYPAEVLNADEFTPKEDVTLIDGVNINPKYVASEENTEPVYEQVNPETEVVDQSPTVQLEINSGIDDFNTEQKEMFYTEETAQYGYDQQQDDAYNQEYIPPEQNYTYYENSEPLQEQETPVEINEHEESTARYDQAYEEQYYDQSQVEYPGQEQLQHVQPEGYDQTGQQQYEGYDQTEPQQYAQPEGYEQTDQQQYVQPEGYEQTDQQQYVQQEGFDQIQQEGYNPAEQQYQDYEYLQHGQETVQNIQQSIDTEQGFVDNYNYEQLADNQTIPETKSGDQQAETVAEPVIKQTAS